MKPIPSNIEDGGLDPKTRRKINEILAVLRTMMPLNTPDVQIDRTVNGFFIRPSAGGNNTTNNQAPRWG